MYVWPDCWHPQLIFWWHAHWRHVTATRLLWSQSHLDISRVCGASEVGVDLFEVALGISASEINQHDSQRMIHWNLIKESVDLTSKLKWDFDINRFAIRLKFDSQKEIKGSEKKHIQCQIYELLYELIWFLAVSLLPVQWFKFQLYVSSRVLVSVGSWNAMSII